MEIVVSVCTDCDIQVKFVLQVDPRLYDLAGAIIRKIVTGVMKICVECMEADSRKMQVCIECMEEYAKVSCRFLFIEMFLERG